MPAYEYLDTVTGETLTTEQRISDKAFAWYDAKLKEFHHGMKALSRYHAVKRLISGAPAVQFISGPSGGWSQTGYALTEPQRKAESKLGRKVTRRA